MTVASPRFTPIAEQMRSARCGWALPLRILSSEKGARMVRREKRRDGPVASANPHHRTINRKLIKTPTSSASSENTPTDNGHHHRQNEKIRPAHPPIVIPPIVIPPTAANLRAHQCGHREPQGSPLAPALGPPRRPATRPGDSLPRPLRRASGDRQLALGTYFSAWAFRVFETFVFIGRVIACCVDGSFMVMVRLMSISVLITLASAKS